MADSRIAEPVTAYNVQETATSESSKPASLSVRGFQKGFDPRRNVRGRPPKGESFAEKYMKALDKDADALIQAHIKRGKGDGTAAERAFTLAAAYKMGLPKQTFVIHDGDSPLAALFSTLAATGALPAPYIDGESRDITSEQ